MPERGGLIRARLAGAKRATGDVIVVLDSHCECTDGWLEPALLRIQQYPKTAIVPVIDILKDDSFKYVGLRDPSINRGIFNWNMIFAWGSYPTRTKNSNPLPSYGV